MDSGENVKKELETAASVGSWEFACKTGLDKRGVYSWECGIKGESLSGWEEVHTVNMLMSIILCRGEIDDTVRFSIVKCFCHR